MPKRPGQNTALVQCFITPAEREALQRLAEIHNTTASDLLRRQIRYVIRAASVVEMTGTAA